MACGSIPANSEFVATVAVEMSHGIERAVDYWMCQFEQVLTSDELTSLGRLAAMRDIVRSYKSSTGKTELLGRPAERRNLKV
jgi:hypothetical protein